ncbi:MAG: hypothetical protein GY699_04830 [Desulfobacteraceae bacterium]|nr:hypothetical protein [Desulfobacteraceae bacterium]
MFFLSIKRIIVIVCIINLMGLTGKAQAAMLDFESYDHGDNIFTYVDISSELIYLGGTLRALDTTESIHIGTGYALGATSGSMTGYNPSGGTIRIYPGNANELFNLHGMNLTAAWMDELEVIVMGYKPDLSIEMRTLFLSSTEPTMLEFNSNWTGLSSVSMNSYGGVLNVDYDGRHSPYNPDDPNSLTQFMVDDLGYTTVSRIPTPIPAGIWLIGSGLIGLTGLRKKLFYKT